MAAAEEGRELTLSGGLLRRFPIRDELKDSAWTKPFESTAQCELLSSEKCSPTMCWFWWRCAASTSHAARLKLLLCKSR